jgi:hypothetical protein
MKLLYRGSTYEHQQTTIEAPAADAICTYRGAAFRCHLGAKVPHTGHSLKYRGATYQG